MILQVLRKHNILNPKNGWFVSMFLLFQREYFQVNIVSFFGGVVKISVQL